MGIFLRIVLVNPRAQKSHRRLPLSIMFLARVIPKSVEWIFVDANVEPNAKLLAEDFIAKFPDSTWVLFTVMPGPQLRWALPWCRRIKSIWPQIKTVWGGYFPSVYTETVCKESSVDFVVKGQGEQPFTELIQQTLSKQPIQNIAGLCFIDSSGELIQNISGRMIRSDKFGLAPYDKINMERYAAKTFLGSRTYNHHSSQGCPYVCNFCAVTNVAQGRWLADTADSVSETIDVLVSRYGANAIEFHDNNFFAAEKRCFDISSQIQHHRIRWWGEGRVDTLLGFSDKTWRAMAQSGLAMVFLGAESGDDETLDAMDKGGLRVADTLALNKRMRRFGVIPEFSFVMGGSVEPERDITRTIALVRQLKKDNPSCEIILYLYTPVPLPGMYDEAVSQGFSFPETLDEWVSGEWTTYEDRRHATTPWMEQRLVRRVYDFEAVLHAKWPSNSDQNLSRWQKKILSLLAWPRFRYQWYTRPIGIRGLQRYWKYRRPEEMGF